MRVLARALLGVLVLLVPPGRHRWALVAVVLVGALIPVTELMVTKIFTDLVTGSKLTDVAHVAPQLGLFVALFLATRVAHAAQRVYRVRLFENAFAAGGAGPTPQAESWRWAAGLELLTILTGMTQIALLAGFFTYLAWGFGLVNMVAIVVLFEVVGWLFSRQQGLQRQYVERKKAKEHVPNSEKVRSRIVSAETGGLASALAVLVLLIVLVFMAMEGWVATSAAIVLFLGLRIQNSTFTALSGATMRLARARANAR